MYAYTSHSFEHVRRRNTTPSPFSELWDTWEQTKTMSSDPPLSLWWGVTERENKGPSTENLEV